MYLLKSVAKFTFLAGKIRTAARALRNLLQHTCVYTIIIAVADPYRINDRLRPLCGLHGIIQSAMGWCDSHLHQFTVEEECIADPEAVEDVRDEKTVRLLQIAAEKGSSFLYTYDFGDDWQHEITVEAVEPRVDASAHVRCTGGARACPPEDCGGIPGYEDLLRVLRDPMDDEHPAMRELVGGRFDSEVFDLGAANRRVREVR